MSKAKNRKIESLRRKQPVKEVEPRILVVCEGYTDQHYIKALKIKYRLTSVTTCCAEGGTPERVVTLACEKRDKAVEDQSPYDNIWCVLDTESSNNKNSFLRAVQNAKKENFNLAVSNPCIEYWFLLHFKHSTAASSDCNQVENTLKNYVSNYEKSQAYKHI